MKTWILTVSILDYWLAGSGRTRGPVLDAEPVKSRAGLPYLPGRTVRGLVREGVQQAEDAGHPHVPPGTVERLFGAPGTEGCLRFSDAVLGEDLETWVLNDPGVRPQVLYRRLGSTAINGDTGQARDETLRFVEVAVPVTLQSSIHSSKAGTEEDSRALTAGVGFVRGLGSGRRRGLGRVQMELKEVTS